ncbi:hypothetical protein [Rosistilla oblonga]|uniref:hypothetical protein n=1 Tax=Rosistilla oblonga TaxID=2527990 RepID=UPI003A96935B
MSQHTPESEKKILVIGSLDEVADEVFDHDDVKIVVVDGLEQPPVGTKYTLASISEDYWENRTVVPCGEWHPPFKEHPREIYSNPNAAPLKVRKKALAKKLGAKQ